jgi:hypothetical protein
VLNSRRFQRAFDRVNLHRPTKEVPKAESQRRTSSSPSPAAVIDEGPSLM